MVSKKSKSYIIDSNVWIGFYNSTDSLHEKSKKTLETIDIDSKRIFVSNIIISEVFTLLSVYKGIDRAKQFFHQVSQTTSIYSIDLDKQWFPEIIRFSEHRKLSPKLSLADVSILFMALLFDAEIVTFDKQLQKAAQQIGAALYV